MDGDKFGKVANAIDAVSITLASNSNVNDLIKAANTIVTGEFILHMSREAVSKPLKFGHMYEWNEIGDPGSRLWTHQLRGRGAIRQLSFNFKASKKSVPVTPALKAVGVEQRHIFVWKSMIMELGNPVRISPKIAQALVFEEKDVKHGATTTGSGFARNGIVVHKGTINIAKAGPEQAWGSFTQEFNMWFRSGVPEQYIRQNISTVVKKTIKSAFDQKIRGIKLGKTKPKTFTLEPVGVDRSFVTTLSNSLRASYIAGAATRRILTQNDEIQ